jgi:hypothetical protein
MLQLTRTRVAENYKCTSIALKMIYTYFCNSEEWILYCRPSDTLAWYPSSDVFGRSREFA